MALWGTHFAIGATGALVVILLLGRSPRRLWPVVLASGLWAIVPDAHWVHPPLREVTKPVIHDTVVSNLFWFHGLVDGSVLDHYDSRARPYLSIPLVVAFLWVYAMAVVLERD